MREENVTLLPTMLVGSYAQPEWLIDRKKLLGRFPPRVRARELWRIPEPFLAEAQDDATVLAIGEMERIGVDIISDGEMRRESYSNYFSLALDGIDSERLGSVIGALKQIRGRQGELRLAAPNQQVRVVLELTTLDKVFPYFATVEEALAGF